MHDVHSVVEIPEHNGFSPGLELEQVLYNLLANSIDALPQGGIVELNCTSEEPNGTRVFALADNGPGTGLNDIGDLFAPFVTSRKRGVGLGLYVSHRIIERRGGTIAWAREDGWTVFRFRFPRDTGPRRQGND